MKARVFISGTADPAANLSIEELRFENIAKDEVSLLIYRNDRCVVIGKHQNPWRECAISELSDARIPIFRRISGGGAVYHDRGNVNFSFLVDRAHFDKVANLELILRGLEYVGISGKMNERGDLLVNGRKISGNALAVKKERVLHHGTLLVSADLAALRRSARSDSVVFRTHAVASTPASVANVSQIRPQITTDLVVQALVRAFRARWGAAVPLLDAIAGIEIAAVEQNALRYGEWEWTFGRTPRFEVEIGDYRFAVEDGRVGSISGTDPARVSELSTIFVGKRFDIEAAAARFAGSTHPVPLAGG